MNDRASIDAPTPTSVRAAPRPRRRTIAEGPGRLGRIGASEFPDLPPPLIRLMKIATFNVNGITARLPRLLEWLDESAPTSPACRSSRPRTRPFRWPPSARPGTARSGTARRSSTASPSWRPAATSPSSGGAACPATPTTRTAATSRRRRTASSSPRSICPTAIRSRGPSSTTSWPGSSVSTAHAQSLIDGAGTVVLAGDYNVVPTDSGGDIYSRARGRRMPCCSRRAATPTGACSPKVGSTRSPALHPGAPMYTYWDYFRNRFPRDAGLRIDHLLLIARAPPRLRRCRCRQGRARHGEAERPRAGVDRAELTLQPASKTRAHRTCYQSQFGEGAAAQQCPPLRTDKKISRRSPPNGPINRGPPAARASPAHQLVQPQSQAGL